MLGAVFARYRVSLIPGQWACCVCQSVIHCICVCTVHIMHCALLSHLSFIMSIIISTVSINYSAHLSGNMNLVFWYTLLFSLTHLLHLSVLRPSSHSFFLFEDQLFMNTWTHSLSLPWPTPVSLLLSSFTIPLFLLPCNLEERGGQTCPWVVESTRRGLPCLFARYCFGCVCVHVRDHVCVLCASIFGVDAHCFSRQFQLRSVNLFARRFCHCVQRNYQQASI